jgi:TonB family protein
MKSPPGKPRARRPVQKKPVQLNLRRTPTWPEDDNDLERGPDVTFWKWFALVFLLHLIAFVLLIIFFNHRPQPPVEFMSLVPPGDVVKGTPGIQSAPKISATTAAPSHTAPAKVTPPPAPIVHTPPKPKVEKVQPPTPKPPPIITDNATTPAPPPKPKPPKPQPPKVKVDLTLANAPDADQPPPPKPVKAKHHPKKATKPTDTPVGDIDSDTHGLSKDQVAQKLGDKLKASGVENAQKTGVDGSTHGKTNDFQDFYASIHDQVMSKWSVPNFVDDTAVDPVVQIHVDKDGRVPAELVTLKRSSNNPAFDQSALEAARGLGYTLQPLPTGCPPDMSITFNLHQQ